MRDSVFISYSHRDREWLDRLNVHLRPLVRDNALVVWDDTKIAPGSTWKTEIEAALAAAKVAVLLVSADFLASDFVAQSEIPALLAAARDHGAVILPLIISASRFTRTPSLAQFQAVNDPAKPLIGLSRSEQEHVLVILSEAVERAMGKSQPTDLEDADVEPVAGPEEGIDTVPLIQRLPLAECLERLGCKPELISQEKDFISQWLARRVTEPLWRGQGLDLLDYLKEIGELEQVRLDVAHFVSQIVAASAPEHGRLRSWYVSARKVSEAHRLLRLDIEPARPADVDGMWDKFLQVHNYLLKTDRLTFLPSLLLLGGDLPTSNDVICYFEGSFSLDVDEGEIARVPGAAEALAKKTASLYGVVSNVFRNADPFAYPLLRFAGHLGKFPANMILSRKYIEFSSGTASFFASALGGSRSEFAGIGTLKHSDGVFEVHPLACGFPS